MKKGLFILLLLVTDLVCISQTPDPVVKKFIKVFNTKNYSDRINMFDTLPDDLKQAYYPFLKDSIDAIRVRAFADNRVNIINKIDKIDGIRLYHEHNYSSAIPVLLRVINTDKTLTDLDSLRIMSCLKKSYLKIRSLSKALEIHKMLTDIFGKRSQKYAKWYFHPPLSSIYYELNIYDEAIRQHRLEFNESTERGDRVLLSYHNNEGVFWNKLHKSDSALFHFNYAKKLAHKLYGQSDKVDDKFTIGLIDGNIGQVYKEQKKFREAIPLLKEDIYWSKADHDFENAAISHNEIGECYINLSEFNLGLKHLDSARVILRAMDVVTPYLTNMRLYGLYYERSGNFQEAIRFYKRYLNFNDSINAAEKFKELISQQVAMQMDEKERIIRQKQYIIDKEAVNKKHQETVRRFMFAGLLVLLFVLFIVFIMYKRAQKQKELLEIKNDEIHQQNMKIEKSLQEKEFLVREVHHRVKNNLQIVSSLLNLQIGMTNSEEIKEALSEAYGRIGSIALVHQLLYRNKELTNISIKEYFENLLVRIEHSFSSENSGIVLEKHIADVQLDLDRAIPLGLIINEIVSNAYKHAFPDKKGLIEVKFDKHAETYELIISDNGVGFKEPFESEHEGSFGIEIIKILTEQINGRIQVTDKNGTRYSIVFN
ncbi:MAG: ATP-binding protein [Bacteroidetes bacterium]|nr:ATP-binding protein [Bacteroidota bacterium]